MDQYHFDPKYLLTKIAQTYINFSPYEEFSKAVANDGRSFKIEVFDRVKQILNKIGKEQQFINQFAEFESKAIDASKALEEEDFDLSEIPDEFLDTITYTLMENPVLLPTSEVYVDKSTIDRHLLNDPTDPFNRSPLSPDDIKLAPELKKQIEEWKASKKKEKK